MENVVRTALDLGYLKLPKESILIDSSEVENIPSKQLLVLTTGSQGEPLAALTRMATRSHRQINVLAGDMVIIAATPIPGNEKLVGKTINHLYQIGAEVVTKEMGQVHVSGHANQEEIKLVIRLTRPRFLIPHHGEIRHQVALQRIGHLLGYSDSDIALTQLGSRVELSSDRMEFGERVEAGSVYIDGLGVGDVGQLVLKDRQQLAQDGVVVVVAALSKGKPYRILSGPDIISRGFTFMKEAEILVNGARKVVEASLEIQIQKEQMEWGTLKSNIRDSLSKYLWDKTRRRPMILPVLLHY
jgi:ribonuclease J